MHVCVYCHKANNDCSFIKQVTEDYEMENVGFVCPVCFAERYHDCQPPEADAPIMPMPMSSTILWHETALELPQYQGTFLGFWIDELDYGVTIFSYQLGVSRPGFVWHDTIADCVCDPPDYWARIAGHPAIERSTG